MNRITWERSEHAGHPIDVDAAVIETIFNGEVAASSKSGEIVYTGLYNYAMPLIRYMIGDVVMASDEVCPCGRGLPLMKHIEGHRTHSCGPLDDQVVSSIIWTLIMQQISGVDQSKAIQEKKNLIMIQIVRDQAYTEATARQILHDVQEVMGEGMHVDVEIVEEIPRDKSGKARCAISKVAAL